MYILIYLLLKNTDYIANLIATENAFFSREVNNVKNILDKMTDLCENSSILNSAKLNGFKKFLDEHVNYLAKNVNIN